MRRARSIKARAWRLRIDEVDIPAGLGERRRAGVDRELALDAPARVRSAGPGRGRPGTASPRPGRTSATTRRWSTGSCAAAFGEPGPAVVWMRMRQPLVAGEEPSPLQRVLVAADSGNGVSATLDWARYLFINVELTVHLHRALAGEWVCLDAITIPEPNGVGRGGHRPLRRARPDRPRDAGAVDRRARGAMSGAAAARPRVLVARMLLPAGMSLLAASCEVVEGGLDVEPERLLELAPGAAAIVADPTVAVGDELLGRGGAAASSRRQLRGRLRQRRPRRLPAPRRRGHQHAGRAHQRHGGARPGADDRRRAADERR